MKRNITGRHISLVVIVFVTFAIANTQGQTQHACVHRDSLTEVPDYPDGKNGYPHETAYPTCKERCLEDFESTYFGLRRQGSQSANAECFYGEEVVPGSGCSWSCNIGAGEYECGGDNGAVSLYTMCPIGKYDLDCSMSCHCASNDVCPILTGECPRNCQDGWYGAQCNKNCPTRCTEGICNKNSGDCDGGCQDGWYGPKCDTECGQCTDGKCDQSSGNCPGNCNDGYYGLKCEDNCPTGCDTKCAQDGGDCTSGCDDGFHGDRCAETCPANCAGSKCSQSDGTCDSGCLDGWFGAKCDMQCGKCADGNCEQSDGECGGQCEDDYYGSDCTTNCPDGCNEKCAQDTGDCNFGCDDGHYGTRCQNLCGGCADGKCEQTSGSCQNGCTDGFFGSMCNEDCPKGCDTKCTQTDGLCSNGCVPGYHGDFCEFNCSKGCAGATCYQANATCDGGCHDGYYKPKCDEMCSQNCHQQKCESVSGNCTEGCVDGWEGEHCDTDINECVRAETNVCINSCQDCLNLQGSYKCCLYGISDSGDACKDQSSTPTWVWPVVAVLLCITTLAILGFGWMTFKYKRLFNKKSPVNTDHVTYDNITWSGHEEPESRDANVNDSRKDYMNDCIEVQTQITKKSDYEEMGPRDPEPINNPYEAITGDFSSFVN